MNFLSVLFDIDTVEELKSAFSDELTDKEIDGLVGVMIKITFESQGTSHTTPLRS